MILSIVQLRLDEIMGGWQDAGTMDAARKLLVDTLARRPDLDLKNLSLTIGRNHAYLQQYLMRGSPRELPEAARHGLAALLGVSPDDLRSTVLPMGGRSGAASSISSQKRKKFTRVALTNSAGSSDRSA